MTKVLILDDDKCSLTILEKYLEYKSDWKIVTALTPEKAQKLLAESEFDVIISDLAMPDTNGLIFQGTVSDKYPKAILAIVTESPIKDIPSYVNFQYKKGAFNTSKLVEDITKTLSA